MTPADLSQDAEKMEQMYKEALHSYKVQIDDLVTQQAEVTFEVDSYVQRARLMRQKHDEVFGQFMEREKETAIGLTFSKTGKKLTEKMINDLTKRQVLRHSAY